MPTNTIQNISLIIELDGVSHSCQFINVQLSLPGRGQGQVTEVACPDGVVTEPGALQWGSATGELFVDMSDGGVSVALETAYLSGAEIAYSMTWYADQASTVARTYTGKAIVNSFTLDWSKPGLAKQPLDLALLTAVPSRPA